MILVTSQSAVPSVMTSVDGTSKNQLRPSQDGGCASVALCFLLRNPKKKRKKPTGVLQYCREGETNCWFPIFRGFPSDRIPKATKDVNVHFFINRSNSCKLYQRIPVNYTSEFRELFEATTCIFEYHSSQNKQQNNFTEYIYQYLPL